jgi:hypothetical protein
MKRAIACGLLLLIIPFDVQSSQSGDRTQKTEVRNTAAKTKLLGAHRLSLQWISWDYFGKAVVTERGGTLYLRGEQKARKGDDYLRIDGIITMVDKQSFGFKGTIVMRVSHINGGKPCRREGEMNFAIRGNRRYWRLQQMDNPCDTATDYVDIFLR